MGRYKHFGIILLLCAMLLACNEKYVVPVYGDIPIGTEISSLDDLQKLIEKYAITKIFIAPKRGDAVEIIPLSLSEITLIHDNNMWQTITTSLPPTANITDIAFIAVKSDFDKYSLSIKNGDNERNIAVYDRLKRNFTDVGMSKRNGHNAVRYMPLDRIVPLPTRAAELTAVFTNGKERTLTREQLRETLEFKLTHWQIEADTLAILRENISQQ